MGSSPNHCYCLSFKRISNWHCKFIFTAIGSSLETKSNNRPVGRVVTRSSLEREVQSRASQIRQYCQRLATARHFFERSSVAWAQWQGDGPPQTCYMLQRNRTSIKKNRFWFDKVKWQLKSQAQKNNKVRGENSTTKHTQNYLIHEYWPKWVSNWNVREYGISNNFFLAAYIIFIMSTI